MVATRPLELSAAVETRSAPLTMADLKTVVDSQSDLVRYYPYVGHDFAHSLLPRFAPDQQGAAEVRGGQLIRYYPQVSPLTPEQEMIFRSDRPRFWREVWHGTGNGEPYCARAEEHWHDILAQPSNKGFDYADFPTMPVYLPQPGDLARQEKIFVGDFAYWLKFRDENNGLVIIDDQVFVTTAPLRDIDTGAVFVLLARPADAAAIYNPPTGLADYLRRLPPSKLPVQIPPRQPVVQVAEKGNI
jgi:hypothetical protein